MRGVRECIRTFKGDQFMYQYRYKTTRGEYWKMSMYFIYHSMTGMVNLVFTAALIALTCAKWESSGTVFRICMVLGCCLFPILQPLAVYLSAGKLASGSVSFSFP